MKKLYFTSTLIILFLIFFIFAPLIPLTRADWPIFQFNPQHDGTDNSETSLINPLNLEWQSPQAINASIVESGNSIYAKTSSGTLYSINVNSGTINWQVQTLYGGEIAFGNSTVYAANGNYIDAYNASDGQHLWTTPDSYSGIPGITYVDGTLYFGSVGNHRLYAVNAATGSKLWEAGMGDSAFAAPAVVNGIVYVGNYQFGMYAFNATTGAQVWLSNTSGGNYYQSPSVVNNIVYNANHTGGIDAFDATTGDLLYQHPFYLGTSTDNALVYSDNTIYTAGANGYVYAFDPSNGQLKWNYNTGAPDNGSAPIIANGIVYYGNQSTLYGLDKQTGSLVWQYITGSVQRIINSNHKLLVSSSNGLYAFTSANQAPIVNQLSSAAVDEGSSYTANGSFTDTDSAPWTATINYGDSSEDQQLSLTEKNFSLDHLYKDNGIYTVIVNITDNQGAIGATTVIVTVNNVNPSLGTIIAPLDPVAVNTQITASADFTDPGVLDTHTAVWDWGDGSPEETVTVSESDGSGNVSDSHIYTQAGVYTITLTVTDKDEGEDTKTTTSCVIIYDPSGGFITSSGHLESQAGAYLSSPEASGEVKFGVRAKYKGNTPEGKTKFNFKEAGLNFESTSYQWYVITGNKARLKGTGKINGAGNYNFLLTAIDTGKPEGERTDTLRMKITDTSGAVIYDNQTGAPDTADPTSAIINGSIKIHK